MNSCVTLHFLGSEKSPRIINQNFRNGDLIEKKEAFVWGLLELQDWRHRFRRHLNCVLLSYKMGEVCIGKNPHKVT